MWPANHASTHATRLFYVHVHVHVQTNNGVDFAKQNCVLTVARFDSEFTSPPMDRAVTIPAAADIPDFVTPAAAKPCLPVLWWWASSVAVAMPSRV